MKTFSKKPDTKNKRSVPSRTEKTNPPLFHSGPETGLLGLQQTIGNRALGRILKPSPSLFVPEHHVLDPSLALQEDTASINEALRNNNRLGLTPHIRSLIRESLGAVSSTRPFDSNTVGAISRFQTTLDSCADPPGFIGPDTLWGLVQKNKNRDTAIQLVMGYYHELMHDHDALEGIRYNPELPGEGRTTTVQETLPCNSRVEIGPAAFESIAALSHAIAHEIQHVRENKLGIRSAEFLSESVEILGRDPLSGRATPKIWPEEDTAGFLDDVIRAYNEGWNLQILQSGSREYGPVMDTQAKRKYQGVFAEIRKEIIKRYKRDREAFRLVNQAQDRSLPLKQMSYYAQYLEAMQKYGIDPERI